MYFCALFVTWTHQPGLVSNVHMQEKLDVAAIMKRIENQQKFLNMTRQDLMAITDIPYATLTSCIQKNTLPRFNDLYLISLAIGIPVDTLLTGRATDANRKGDIMYWRPHVSQGISRRYLLRFPDKIAISKTIEALVDGISPFVLSLPPEEITKSMEELKAGIFFNLLFMDDIFSIFQFTDMVKEINKFYVVKPDEAPTIVDYFLANSQMATSLWGYPYLAVQNLWQVVHELIPTRYSSVNAFLKDAGINSQSYNKYLNACTSHASPGTETVLKVCSLLGIDDIDGAIRSKLPDIPAESSNPYQKAGLIPHEIDNAALRSNLKPLPYLAMFFDAFFSLNYNTLLGVYNQILRIDSSKIKSTEALRRLPFPDNAYSIGADTLNELIEKDYQIQR